jgi:hypothetical protein
VGVNKMLFNNGILVQAIDKESIGFTYQSDYNDEEFNNLRAYQGVGRYYLSWPLSIEEDIISKQLTAETEKWFITNYSDNTVSYNLEAVPDKELCAEYINHCKKKSIKIRVLFCRTEIEKPIWSSEIPDKILLGYDYASRVGFDSTIPEELLDRPVFSYLKYPVYKELVQCRDKLNNKKLFSNQDDIVDYIIKREKVIKSDILWITDIIDGKESQSHLIEPEPDYDIIELSEVIKDPQLFNSI